jgi:tripartite-type tricarboxylate transporter receptor subunit TctC
MTIATGFFRSGPPHAASSTVTARKVWFALAFSAAWTIGGFASAQVYPLRPITRVVGYSVGGPSDTIARIMAERMKVTLGQPVVIENVNGAAGSIAVGRVARAAPDG